MQKLLRHELRSRTGGMTGWSVGLSLFGLTVVSFQRRDLTVPPRLSLRKTL